MPARGSGRRVAPGRRIKFTPSPSWPHPVMAGLVPAIHDFLCCTKATPGCRPAAFAGACFAGMTWARCRCASPQVGLYRIGADIWVIRACQEKSKSGIATPRQEIDRVRQVSFWRDDVAPSSTGWRKWSPAREAGNARSKARNFNRKCTQMNANRPAVLNTLGSGFLEKGSTTLPTVVEVARSICVHLRSFACICG